MLKFSRRENIIGENLHNIHIIARKRQEDQEKIRIVKLFIELRNAFHLYNSTRENGGADSGNWGHAGRPGLVGGSREKGVKSITITGNELGEYSDKKELRKKVIDYYKKYIQGDSVYLEGLGEVKFSRNGIDETISKSKWDEEALLVIPYLKEIIKTAPEIRKDKLKHPRKDKADCFFTLKNWVKINGITKSVEILLKYEFGCWYYCLFVNIDRNYTYKENYRRFPPKKGGLLDNPLHDSINYNSLKVNTQNENYVLNIFIKEDEKEAEARRIYERLENISAVDLIKLVFDSTQS